MSLLTTDFVLCLWLGLLELSYGATIKHYNFDMENMIKQPGHLKHVVMGINNHFPCPTITAEVFDTLAITLTNKLLQKELLFNGMESDSVLWRNFSLQIQS